MSDGHQVNKQRLVVVTSVTGGNLWNYWHRLWKQVVWVWNLGEATFSRHGDRFTRLLFLIYSWVDFIGFNKACERIVKLPPQKGKAASSILMGGSIGAGNGASDWSSAPACVVYQGQPPLVPGSWHKLPRPSVPHRPPVASHLPHPRQLY